MQPMFKFSLSLILSFLCWLAYLMMLLAIAPLMGFSIDRYASLFVICCAATTASAISADGIRKKFIPHYSEQKFIGIFAAVILIWIASSFLGNIEIDYKAASLLGHSLALFVAYKNSKPLKN